MSETSKQSDNASPGDILWTRNDPFELIRLRAEVKLLRYLESLRSYLSKTRDAEGALRFAVRSCREHFGASAACFAILVPPGNSTQLMFSIPQPHLWDLNGFAQVLRGHKPAVQPNAMFARIRRRDRAWGVLALKRSSSEFDRADRQALVRIGVTLSELLLEIDLQRAREVRDRIDRKIMSELRPIDLSYQILDALRSLTGYDHSSALLMRDESGAALQIVAEQIAWRKGKSRRVGEIIRLNPDMQHVLREGNVMGFTRRGNEWEEWEARSSGAPIARALDYNFTTHSASEKPESQILCAPLMGKDGLQGVLKIAAVHEGTLGIYEGELVSAFMPEASIAVQNANRAESLQSKMIAAERKHAMADLARGVAHDLNNALGSVVPLVQQMREEAQNRLIDPETAAEDLQQIERSLQVCKRIFGGMLTFARRAATNLGSANLRQAVDCTMAILGENLRRRGIVVVAPIDESHPAIAAAQNDLEQVLLNLLTNARDALQDGGEIRISATLDQHRATIIIEDNGAGIAAEHLGRISEPFFTTKPQGSGLGLSICRSILWDIGGEMKFESTTGRGTRVTLLLPIVATS